MLFRDRVLKTVVTHLVLVSLAWLTIGGPAWAEEAAARQDPASRLERLADNPRLRLTAEQRQALRDAAQRPNAMDVLERLARQEGVIETSAAERDCCSGVEAQPSPAQRMADLEAELRADSSSPAEAMKRFAAADAVLRAEFENNGRALAAAGLSAEVLDRHRAVVAEYEAVAAGIRANLERAKEGDAQALSAVAEALADTHEERAHRAYDPARLPYAVAEPIRREPGRPAAEASATPADGPLVRSRSQVAPALTALPASSTPPTPADLEETLDVRLTQEVRDLAESLDRDPLRIYDWVRNNIEFYPTWGSVQGSQRTLRMGRGNATDIASLLIALLRAAEVPARYATGTIEVPAVAAQNWVGDTATPRVAQQILGQGGVANVGLLDGDGSLSAIRLEHVWVEAWIDNVPSRGAVHREGDTWLPLDAAFKQYTYSAPSQLFADVPFDSVLDPADPPFVVDESLGRITEVDTDAFDARLTDWVEDADEYLVNNGVEQTHEGILGGREVLPQTSSIFAGELPNAVVERDGAVSELPASLRHRARMRGFRSTFDRALGSPTFDFEISLPEIDAQRLGLRFLPATQGDADVLDAARANGASSLPVYLIDVVPVIELDGVEIARGGSMGMGRDFFLDVVLISPGGSDTVSFQVVAGDEIVVGINGNGVGPEVVEERFNAVPVDGAPEYLHQVQLHYWAETDYLGEVAASRNGVHPLRLPSVGLFSSKLSVSYVFGAPRSAVYSGRVMDVQRSLVGAAGADPETVIGWVKQSGAQGSYLEGAVFEQLAIGNNGGPRPSGISSIHLITAAFSKDVPIYRITPQNAAAVQPLLNLPAAVERDIANALAAGQTVLAPESAIDLGPWSGVGYILQNEETGGGAYLISGGFAGGGILDCLRELVPSWETVLAFILFLIFIALIIALILSAPAWAPAAAGAAAVFLAFLVLWRGMGPTTAPPTVA